MYFKKDNSKGEDMKITYGIFLCIVEYEKDHST